MEGKGIGRRKDLERLWQRHSFLQWAPCELELHQQQPLESSYQAAFRSGPGLESLPQRLVHFVQVRPAHASTTYQQNFCQTARGSHSNTNKIGHKAQVTTSLPDLLGPSRPKMLQHYLHAGVSECLNWSRSLNKNG
ncbi:ciliary microtubule inner protein 7 [Tenrec ecaudatus]|uniref:ciliary microtubule inner protein 7 n=1 Tax=Tenrec ecaudatus TaxID=94439 RepID=UPI003F596DF8